MRQLFSPLAGCLTAPRNSSFHQTSTRRLILPRNNNHSVFLRSPSSSHCSSEVVKLPSCPAAQLPQLCPAPQLPSCSAVMGREESKTPLLENYANGSSPNDSASASSAFPSGQVPPADDVPPPYTDTPPSTAFLNYHHHHPEPSPSREALLSRDKYGILSAKTQKDPSGSKTTVISRSLSSDPDLLGEFISAQARLMPNPLVRLLGTHTETHERRNSERTTTVTDFDLSISLADLLTPVWRRTKLVENGMKAYRGERRKTVATGYKSDPESTDTAPRLEEWYHRFCASPAGVKT